MKPSDMEAVTVKAGDTSDDLDGGMVAFIAQAPVSVALFDRDLRYIAWSRRWSERYGTGARDLRGLPHDTPFPDAAEDVTAVLLRGLADECFTSEDTRISLPDGHILCDRLSVQPVHGLQGRISGLVVYSETTPSGKAVEAELKTSEMPLRLLVDALGIGFVESSLETDKLLTSRNFRQMLGLTDSTMPSSTAEWVEFLNPSDPEAFLEMRAKALDPKERCVIDTEVRPTVDGVMRTMRLCGYVEFVGGGENAAPKRFIGVLIDETERQELHNKLVRTQRLEAVGHAANIIAHDFNNLLSVIIANLELALLHIPDGATTELLQRATSAAEMGGNFNKKLLALSSNHDPAPVLVDLDQHILKTWAVLERVLGEGSSLHFQPGCEKSCVRIDPSELDGAILNLVLNARDAQPEGGQIVIATRPVDAGEAQRLGCEKPGGYLELSVKDEGIGMSQAEVAHAREPFFTKKSRETGTGLGLTSVAATVARANGQVFIESEPGKGAKVSILLPVAECPRATRSTKTEMPTGDGQLVLVVEDDPLVREATLKRFEALGYAVLEASNGVGAKKLLEEGEPVDLVFTDVVMPGGVSGYDLVQYVQTNYPEVAVLLTSGHLSRHHRTRMDPEREPEVLKKPYNLETLAKAAHHALAITPAPE